MSELFVGIDIQSRRDCCYAITDKHGLLQGSGWFGKDHKKFLDLLKKLAASSKVNVGIDSPRMTSDAPRQWYCDGK